VVSDILLGWTTVADRPYQVRQFRNRKGSVDPAALAAIPRRNIETLRGLGRAEILARLKAATDPAG